MISASNKSAKKDRTNDSNNIYSEKEKRRTYNIDLNNNKNVIKIKEDIEYEKEL